MLSFVFALSNFKPGEQSDTALRLSRDCLTISERLHGETTFVHATVVALVGRQLERRHEFGEALEMFEQQLSILMCLGTDHRRSVAEALACIGRCLMLQGNVTEGTKRLIEAQRVTRAVYGANSTQAATDALRNLGFVLTRDVQSTHRLLD
eukprot:CAMPEP_0168598960 /NCGR_PEP_ID=MMETSP0420-20121227/11764_1 /TAXON_ID=498008 /ORGANISM="Pessonella sp." /LENGTH=150 /DNA_ID=CAMNT_0008636489 /DNA_START=3 /DNA_END=452 /DNA_ORIENTATION=-